jgi:signal transduction histidine kinase
VVENISRQVCFALKMHDLVTDRDRAVVARRHAEAAVDERSEFLAQMSHELRNPLQGLLGLSGSLLDTPLTEEQQQYAELIHRSGEWMVAIANDVLDFSKLEAGKLKLESAEFEWLPLLEELVAIAAERARSKGLDLVLRTDPAMPDASTDSENRPGVSWRNQTHFRQSDFIRRGRGMACDMKFGVNSPVV